MGKQQEPKDDLQHAPLISYALLGQVLRVGPAATKSAAQRLGIEPQRMLNGRALLTFEQAATVARSMTGR
jgi:hypothetical protein